MPAPWPALIVLAVVMGCDSLPPAPPRSESLPGPPPVIALAPRAAPPAIVPSPNPTVLQVEVSGQVSLPAEGPRGRRVVALSDGPCFQPGSHVLALGDTDAQGSFHLTAFPPIGTQLEACGALVEPLRSGLSFWGRAERGTMPVHGRGKMVYADTAIGLRRGPEVPLPPGVKFEAAHPPVRTGR